MIPDQGTQGCPLARQEAAALCLSSAMVSRLGHSCVMLRLRLGSLPAGTHLAHGCWAEGLVDCLPDAAPVLCVRRGQHAVVLGGFLHLQKGGRHDSSGGQPLTFGCKLPLLDRHHTNQVRRSSCKLLWQLPLSRACVCRILLTASRTAYIVLHLGKGWVLLPLSSMYQSSGSDRTTTGMGSPRYQTKTLP